MLNSTDGDTSGLLLSPIQDNYTIAGKLLASGERFGHNYFKPLLSVSISINLSIFGAASNNSLTGTTSPVIAIPAAP